MKPSAVADTIRTYLTLMSALLLPVLVSVWLRSYVVSDRFYRAHNGRAVVAGVMNGELAVYTGRTDLQVDVYEHRAREANWGWSNRRSLQRMAGREHAWFLGFGYARGYSIPWRGVVLRGRAVGVCVPLWFLVLVTGAMPLRLLARNVQTSEQFLADRAAEEAAAKARQFST